MLKKINATFITSVSVTLILFLTVFNSSAVLKDNYSEMRVYSVAGSVDDGVKSDGSYIKAGAGESYIINSEGFSVDGFFNDLKGKILFTESGEYGISYYGYSPEIRYRERVNGKTVNIQLLIRNGFIKAGFPVIYGGY